MNGGAYGTVKGNAMFADWLREFRIKGLKQTQRELAAWLGVHPVTVGSWETDKAFPIPTFYRKLADVAAEMDYPAPPDEKNRRAGPKD